MKAVQRKPVDVGDGSVRWSFAQDGGWLSVGALDRKFGLVELVGVPRLEPDARNDPDRVRRHRDGLADATQAVISYPGSKGHWDPERADWSLRGNGWRSTAALAQGDVPGSLVQRHELVCEGASTFTVRLTGRVDRPEYAMITPVGRPPDRLAHTVVEIHADDRGDLLLVVAEDTGFTVRVTTSDGNASWQRVDGDWVHETRWVSAGSRTVEVEVGCGPGMVLASDPAAQRTPTVAPRVRESDPLDQVSRGAARYTHTCTATWCADSTCCLVTDHRLLPLSWTRDAYYQAALLLAHATAEDIRVVDGHLAWLWHRSRQSDGVWHRSHLVDGSVLDPAYQADQQLFPILELTDFRRTTGRWPCGEAAATWGERVRAVWELLPRTGHGLVESEENPADDPAGYPYLLSTQLLMAYAVRGAARYQGELGIADLTLADQADQTLSAVHQHFATDGPFGPQWSYDTDANGRGSLYHDANDVPTAVAPLWGLVATDNVRWYNTMRFAWSTHNPGYVPGAFGGLGSRHTAGVWPLGDAQEWAVARAVDDVDREASVTARLSAVASADGMLPETYHPGDGSWQARPWFAWPGSLVGLLHETFHLSRGPWCSESFR